ncbi:AsmA family protein [Desulfocurvibacter africanus]|uniref:AsmA family protein n=1 Tax=Desulfocurvibacter africanus subsp. africanus str. Walvis Bay TaxID=690850 RepID=F3Z3E8_DESAF|nr:AsmA family protein [Desulfocurvibacter africanus]EGJ51488.1 AsmA family protein [Desulfocurvibacter africanus subsp. africanus str. Walvis Bay]
MRKPFKVGLIIFGVLVALVIVAALVLPMVVDPNQYKGRIAQEVQKATGREFAVEGDIDLSVFPWLGVEIGRMHMANAEGFGDEPMIAVENAEVRVKLLPLLSRELIVDTVVIQNPVIRLAKDEQGRTNWQDILDHMERQAAEKPAEPEQPQEPGASPLQKVELAGLEVENGLLVWSDMQAKASYEVRELNVDVGELSMEAQPFPVSVNCAFVASQPQASGNLELNSVITLMLDQKTARAERTNLKLNIDKLVQQAEGSTQSVTGRLAVAANAVADWGQGVADIQGLKLTSDLRADLESASQGGRATQKISAQSTVAADAVVRWVEGLARINGLALTTDYTVNMADSAAKAAGPQSIAGHVELVGNTEANWTKSVAQVDGLKVNTTFTLDQPASQAGSQPQRMTGKASLATDMRTNWAEGLAQLGKLALTAEANGQALPSGKANLAFGAETMNVNWTTGRLELPRFTAKAYVLDMTGSLQGESLLEKPNLRGSLSVAEFSPRALMQALAMEIPKTADAAALKNASAKLNFQATQDSAAISNLEAKLDETVLTGKTTVQGFERPDIAFTLAANRLNADRYMPPKAAAEEKKPAPAPAPTSAPAEKKPAEESMLQKMTVNGTVNVGQFQAMNVKASDVRMTVRGKDGVFHVDPFSANMYSGKVTATAGATLREQITNPSLALNIANLQIGPLLDDYLGKLGWIGGSTTAKLDLSGQGALDAIMKTLDGSGDVTIQHGLLRGFNIVPGAVSQLFGTVASGSLEKVTKFDQLGARFDIDQGDLDFKRLFMVTADSKVESKGAKVSLAQESLSMPLTMVSNKIPNIKGVPIDTLPLVLSGSYSDLSNLKLGVDEKAFQQIVQQKASGAVQKELQKQLGGKLPGGLGDVLDGSGKSEGSGGTGGTGQPGGGKKSSGNDVGKAIEEGLGGLLGGGKKK